jgi:serine/threonine protein kinase
MMVGEYQVLQLLGCGGFGAVYSCQNAATGNVHAIKLGTHELVDPGDALDRESLQPDEWRAYKVLDYGRGVAAQHGVPAVHETGKR